MERASGGDPRRALVYGLAVAGRSTVRALRRRDVEVVVADDRVDDDTRRAADELGVELVDSPDVDRLTQLLGSVDLYAPAPGIPEDHRSIVLALELGVDVASEVELAHRWEQDRPGGPRPMLAVTGTDGKTTTTLMAAAMLEAAGVSSIDAGNTSTPLVDAIDARRADGTPAYDAFVVECASFRLAWTPTFRPDAGAWLNLSPDHLDWHRDLGSYERAKAQIWANQRPDDVAIGFLPDETVMRHLAVAPGRRRTFGDATADYRVDGDQLVGPDGPIAHRSAMRRALPHDVSNALAAAALVIESGLADREAVAAALADFVGPPHRLEHLATVDGVDWFNDSKATTPHAASVAIRAFDDVVLIAGGKDKQVDLSSMAAESRRVSSVVALGQTRDAIAAHFSAADPSIEVSIVDDLDRAVDVAAASARPGQTVLLSPGCASLDMYGSFEERGDHFRRLVADRTGSSSSASSTTSSATPSAGPPPAGPPSGGPTA